MTKHHVKSRGSLDIAGLRSVAVYRTIDETVMNAARGTLLSDSAIVVYSAKRWMERDLAGMQEELKLFQR